MWAQDVDHLSEAIGQLKKLQKLQGIFGWSLDGHFVLRWYAGGRQFRASISSTAMKQDRFHGSCINRGASPIAFWIPVSATESGQLSKYPPWARVAAVVDTMPESRKNP